LKAHYIKRTKNP